MKSTQGLRNDHFVSDPRNKYSGEPSVNSPILSPSETFLEFVEFI